MAVDPEVIKYDYIRLDISVLSIVCNIDKKRFFHFASLNGMKCAELFYEAAEIGQRVSL